jgi:hypothetical protein
MHASIALCLMMVGGPVAPEPDIIDVPLRVDSPTSMDEIEWKESSKRMKLPRVPTLGEESSAPGDYRGNRGRYTPPTDPNALQRRQSAMPMSPTDPGNLGGGSPMGQAPGVPGSGIVQGYQGQGSQGQGYAPNRSNTFNPGANNFSKPVNGNYGGVTAQTSAPSATRIPSASDTMGGIMNIANQTGGASANPMLNQSAGGQKPFNDYQRPSGYSPWMNLYTTPTNNGTMSTYTTSIQPTMQQQQYNRQIAEQIQGVRNALVAPPSHALDEERNIGAGNGLVNPNSFLNYGPYYPQMNH